MVELGREGWATAGPIRRIFKAAFEAVGVAYFNPHSFRHILVRHGMDTCRTPEKFKAWSQNLGHDGVLVTFNGYGTSRPTDSATSFVQLARRTMTTLHCELGARCLPRNNRGRDSDLCPMKANVAKQIRVDPRC